MSIRETNAVTMDQIVSLCKRRGFVYPSAEIYGGFANAWDYGPLGVEMRRNIREQWWLSTVRERDDVVGIEAAIITNPRVWVASGHVESFNDSLVECRNCHNRFRADNLPGATIAAGGAVTIPADLPCPVCGKAGQFTEPRNFNTMFKTHVGVVEEAATVAYLPPETAQSMFINFALVQTTARKKLPFGIAQIRKSFRNEITPGNFIFRTREFEQMELEYFVRPGAEEEWFAYWRQARMDWYLGLGIRPENIRFYDVPKDELAHYSRATTDFEYRYPFGWGELEGVASRGDYDMQRHIAASGEPLTFFDEETREHIVPYVIEPAVGVDRVMSCCSTPTTRSRTTRGRALSCACRRRSRRSRRRSCRWRRRNRWWVWRARSRAGCAAATRSSTTTPATSAAAIAARTRSARRSASPSTSTRSKTARSPSATATRCRKSASRSARSARSWRRRSRGRANYRSRTPRRLRTMPDGGSGRPRMSSGFSSRTSWMNSIAVIHSMPPNLCRDSRRARPSTIARSSIRGGKSRVLSLTMYRASARTAVIQTGRSFGSMLGGGMPGMAAPYNDSSRITLMR
jgi:glycyl-tRNA synthetase